MLRLACFLKVSLFAFWLVGCVGAPPIKDYTLADAAIKAAQSSGAARYAPGFWTQAEESYRKATQLYKDREYDQARAQFKKARNLAERAENASRLEKFKSGDGFL